MSSWELVAAAQGGDREAFGRLYSRYVGPVGRFLASRVPDRALAADLTSETFVRALRRIESVSDQGRDVGAWLTTIARNLVVDHYKSSRARLETLTGEFPDQGPVVPVARQLTPEEVVIERETTAALWRHVARLPADQGACIQRRFGEGLSVAQTAAAMHRSADSVKGLQHRAISGLRAQLVAEDPPADRAAGGDSMVRARRAVAAAQARAAGVGEARPAGEVRSRRVAGWAAGDRAVEERERGALGVPVVEGVA